MHKLISHKFSDDDITELVDHLRDVGSRAAKLVEEMPLNLVFHKDDLVKAAFITGICHDFGKAKKQFQEYIWTGHKVKEREHAVISSIFGFIVSIKIFKNSNGLSRLLPFVCAYAINRHHSLLVDIDDAFSPESLQIEYAVARNNIDERIWDLTFDVPYYGIVVFKDFRDVFMSLQTDDIAREFEKFRILLREQSEKGGSENSPLIDLYLTLLVIVSVIAESDVACVIEAPLPNIPSIIPIQKIEEFLSKLKDRGSQTFRMLRKKAWENVRSFTPSNISNTFRLNLPTGIGKTLMGLHLATKLQHERQSLTIYSLPYLSIIEQVSGVAKSVFCNEPDSLRVLQYHSLTFPEARDSKESPNFEQARFATEDWDSDIVVTTFDQLFYSFLSGQRSFIRRFWRLAGATLILDEVQTVPSRIISLIETLLQRMSTKLEMTATNPPFLKEAVKIVQDDKEFFTCLNRTRIILNLESMKLGDYLDSLPAFLSERKFKSIMFVANTIKCSFRLFEFLQRLKKEQEDFHSMRLFYISGAVVPIERINKIKEIKKLLESESSNKEWIVIVATQCVEAGVDIDVDEIVRDFAPWDSLMQVCGRANRNDRKFCATVWVHRWVDDERENSNRLFADYIYDCVLLDATLRALNNNPKEFNESGYLTIQRRYTEELEKSLSLDKYRSILANTLAWKFSEIDEFRKEFREGDAFKVSIFCVADETSAYLKEIATLLWSSKDSQAALLELEKLFNSDHFPKLAEFLKIDSRVLMDMIRDIKSKQGRSQLFEIQRMLSPMLHAYTISVSERALKEVDVSFIIEGFCFLDNRNYRSLLGPVTHLEDISEKLPDNIC